MKAFVLGVATLLVGLVLAASASAATGSVWTWGLNGQGELGDGSTAMATSPVSVLANATRVAGGYDHSLAVLSNGTVKAWGANQFGQLGVSTGTTVCGKAPAATPCSTVPFGVGGLSHVVAVAAGVHFSLALVSNGTVWAWGENQFGQLGAGGILGPSTCDGISCSPTPVMVSGLTNAKAIAAGGAHALALLNNGTVMAWGLNLDGQLGDGSSTGPITSCFNHAPCSPTPIPVTTPNRTPLKNVEAIAAGDAFSLALVRFTAGVTHVDAWGYNGFGQLGTGSTTGPITCANGDPCATTPGTVSGLSGTETAIAASGNAAQALALEQDGSVAAWGDNEFGQAGSACGNPFCPSPKLVPGVSGATAISTSGGRNSFRSMALESSGQAVEWGSTPLGNGTYPGGSTTPVNVTGMTAASAIAAGGVHSLALAPPPPNRFSLSIARCRCSIVTLKIHVPGPGVLSAVQTLGPHPGPLAVDARKKKKSKPLVKPVIVTVTKAGTVKVELKLTAAGKRALKRKHKLRVKVLITFTPTGGTPASKTIKVTFRRR